MLFIRPINPQDTSWVTQALTNLWGSTRMVSRGKMIDLTGLDGFIAEEDGRKVGLITYVIASNLSAEASAKAEAKQSRNNRQSSIVNSKYSTCEIISLNSLTPGKGIGTSLLEKVQEIAKEKKCHKITIDFNEITNNFFLKKGFIPKEGKLEMVLV